MDLEKGVKECKTKMGKCYVCLEDYDKFYLSCNTCKDGKICFNCSDSLINSCYDNKNLLKCGLCRKEFDININRHTKIYNIKNIKVIKYLYILISFCIFYVKLLDLIFLILLIIIYIVIKIIKLMNFMIL